MDWILQHLGLMVLTVVSAVLTVYLIYVMLRPERF
ncbi:MAG: K(+)-transporting ATPase subunit F [Thermoplasmata archaeon]